MDLSFAEEYQETAQKYLEEIFKKEKISMVSTRNKIFSSELLKLKILGNKTLSLLHELQQLTGINPTTIDVDNKETLELFYNADTLCISEFETNIDMNIIKEIKPTNFEELIKIYGLSYGTDVWSGNMQDLISNGTIKFKDAITTRDDIMNYLILKGLEPECAFNIMETIRKGKVRGNREPNWKNYKQIMKKHNIPEWYILSCEKISYMFPKAHCVVWAINTFRLAYYKIHYPEIFKIVKEN